LKAYLVYQGIDFPYTHNISLLLELCAKHANWAEKLREAEELTPYAITARYPGEDEKVSKKETLRAIKIASHVREVVRAEFTKNGIIFNKSSE
jgi:HEPN domain-containing protein